MRTALAFAATLLSVAAAHPAVSQTAQAHEPPVREGHLAGADGVRLFFRAVGDGPDTVVFIHGGPGGHSGQMHRDLLPLSKGRTVLYYDQRGAGRSELPEDTTALTLSHHVRDLEALRQHFGLERMTLFAHSFGPAIPANYAIQHPERVERMLLIGPIPPRRGAFLKEYRANMRARVPWSGADPRTGAGLA